MRLLWVWTSVNFSWPLIFVDFINFLEIQIFFLILIEKMDKKKYHRT